MVHIPNILKTIPFEIAETSSFLKLYYKIKMFKSCYKLGICVFTIKILCFRKIS